MPIGAVNTFLNEFKITKFEFARQEDVKQIIKKINLK